MGIANPCGGSFWRCADLRHSGLGSSCGSNMPLLIHTYGGGDGDGLAANLNANSPVPPMMYCNGGRRQFPTAAAAQASGNLFFCTPQVSPVFPLAAAVPAVPAMTGASGCFDDHVNVPLMMIMMPVPVGPQPVTSGGFCPVVVVNAPSADNGAATGVPRVTPEYRSRAFY